MPASEWLKPKLEGWANQMYFRFGGAPVYLVGSSLTKDDPRDIDITIVMDDDQFRSRWGFGIDALKCWKENGEEKVGDWNIHAPNWPTARKKWAREIAGLVWSLHVYDGLNVDLKIISESEQELCYKDHPRMRLDGVES